MAEKQQASTAKTAKKPTTPAFEDELAALETIVQALEAGELPLADALKQYESGVAGLRRCYDLLRDAEAKIEELVDAPDGSLQTRPTKVETTDASPSVGE